VAADHPAARCVRERERGRREKEIREREGREAGPSSVARLVDTHQNEAGPSVTPCAVVRLSRARRVGVIRAYVVPRHRPGTRHPSELRQCT
jgi:hypothetical protein